MIDLGLLGCLTVLLLTRWDRQAVPWAALILSYWLFGLVTADWLYAPRLWPLINLTVCIVSLVWFLRSPMRWKAGVHALAVLCLLCDLWMFSSSASGVYVGQEYDKITDMALVGQLVLIGHRGARNAFGSLLHWCDSRLSGRSRLSHSHRMPEA